MLNKRTIYWLIPFSSVPVFIILLAVLHGTHPRHRRWKEEGRVASSTNIYAEWEKSHFVPISTNSDLLSEIQSIKVTSSNWLSNAGQLTALQESVYDLMVGYNTANYDIYRRFRFPVLIGEWNNKIIRFDRQFLEDTFPEEKPTLGQGNEAIFKEWFEYTFVRNEHTKDLRPIIAATHRDRGFPDFFSIDSSAVYVETKTDLAEPLNLFVTSFGNDGYADYTSSFKFSPTPEELLTKEKSITYATVMLMLKTTGDRAMPQYIRLYWANVYKKWLPLEYCVPCTSVQKNVFAF